MLKDVCAYRVQVRPVVKWSSSYYVVPILNCHIVPQIESETVIIDPRIILNKQLRNLVLVYKT